MSLEGLLQYDQILFFTMNPLRSRGHWALVETSRYF